MKKFEKIIDTIAIISLCLFGLYLAIKFFIGVTEMDDEVMYISGLSLMVYVLIIILIRITVIDIYIIWENKKKRGSKK